MVELLLLSENKYTTGKIILVPPWSRVVMIYPQDCEAGLTYTGLPCGFLHIVLVPEILHFRKQGIEVD